MLDERKETQEMRRLPFSSAAVVAAGVLSGMLLASVSFASATESAAGVTAAPAPDHEKEHEEEALEEVGHVLGFVTVALMIVGVCLAAFRKTNPRRMLALHKLAGAIALLTAIAHAAIMILH